MTYLELEIMTEVAWQLGDVDGSIPRVESRWRAVDIAGEIIEAGLVTDDTEDIDEVVNDYLCTTGCSARSIRARQLLTTDELKVIFSDKLTVTGNMDAAFTKAVWIAYKRGVADGEVKLAATTLTTD